MNRGSPASRRAGRTRARRAALQAVYQWQLNRKSGSAIASEFTAERELKNVDIEYFTALTRGIPRHASELAAGLSRHLELEWDAVTPVERAALLVGAYELMHCPEVPYRVAINEAVDLVKVFGAEEGYRLVNAVLDGFAAEVRGAEVAATMWRPVEDDSGRS